jgi:large subunit ribosomal protein L11
MKGSGEPNKNKVGRLTMKDIEEVAKIKMPDLNAYDLAAARKIIEGTARSMGIEVV